MAEHGPVRRAIVTSRSESPAELKRIVAVYLPGNYHVTRVVPSNDPILRNISPKDASHVLISGRDNAGWTLHDYVIPRLRSGLYFATELKDGEERSRPSHPHSRGQRIHIIERLDRRSGRRRYRGR